MTTQSDPMFDRSKPALPYDGTAGFAAGSAESRDQARREAEDGTATARQGRVLSALGSAGPLGMTIAEFRDTLARPGEHHGKISSAFSSLHKVGTIARLKERRNGSAIYVLPNFVGKRDTSRQGRRSGVARGGEQEVVEVEVVREVPRQIAQDDAEFVRQVRAAVAPYPTGPNDTITVKTNTLNYLLSIIDNLVREG
jgi:hypothetical protein